MKWIRVILTFGITLGLLWFFNNKQIVADIPLPPLGKFFNPESGFWQNSETREDLPSEKLNLAGLQEPVSVVYDSILVPHIFANNPYDLYFTQGYVTAQHRLWQMEFQTYFAGGRIAELVAGEGALNLDRLHRRLGYREAAKEVVQNFQKDPRISQMVTAYQDGINAYIAQLDYASMPFEYKLLGYEPEPWTLEKTGLLLIYMGSSLTGRDYDLQNTNMLALLGSKDRFDFFFPDYAEGIDPVIPNDHQWPFAGVPRVTPDTPYFQEYIKEVIPMSNPQNGSNNWAVHGSKTKNGTPILANDPHLQLNLPSLWYMVQLHGPDVNVMGASLPGAPGIIIGFNDSIAWGVTNGTQDVRDWYRVQFKDATWKEYFYDGNWLKTQLRVEEIVRNDGTVYRDTVYVTHFGPVVYDRGFPNADDREPLRGYALRWTLQSPREELAAFYELNHANNYEDYARALPKYGVPSQNFVFASVSNDVAIWQQGDIPVRFVDQGKFLMEGANPDLQWNEMIPAEQNPNHRNPPRGFVSSANQVSAGPSYPYPIIENGFEYYRNRRINQQLTAWDSITVQDMMELQQDNFGLKAAENLPWMLDSLNDSIMTAEQRDAYEVLRGWDYQYVIESAGPVVFEIWWDTLMQLTWDEWMVDSLALRRPHDYRSAQILLAAPNDTLMDIVGTLERETTGDLLRISFAAAAAVYAEAVAAGDDTWGPWKGTTVRHLSRQLPLSENNLATHGYRGIVNATSQGHGPSWRMVVELSNDGPNAYGVYPGGQSGNPGSWYYKTFIERWRTGNYYPLHLMRAPADATQPLTIQHLNPAN